jgi:hypothetical protein
MISTRTIELLDAASLFLFVASLDDIDQERQRLEAVYKQDLLVHDVSYPTHSGARCTRVTWQCLR